MYVMFFTLYVFEYLSCRDVRVSLCFELLNNFKIVTRDYRDYNMNLKNLVFEAFKMNHVFYLNDSPFL